MRKMKASWMSKPVNVYGWAMTVNGWEYYFLDNKKGDIREAYVCGDANEQGDVSLSELRPYIRSITFNDSDLQDLAPAFDCQWVD
jgi:hypothetical protein